VAKVPGVPKIVSQRAAKSAVGVLCDRLGPLPCPDRPVHPRHRHRRTRLRDGDQGRAGIAIIVLDRGRVLDNSGLARHTERIAPMTAGLAIQATTGLNDLPIGPGQVSHACGLAHNGTAGRRPPATPLRRMSETGGQPVAAEITERIRIRVLRASGSRRA
jgi:hypothetical protein